MSKFDEYYINQARAAQTGGSLKIYRGANFQAGYGLGSIFRTLRKGASYFFPILKTHALPVLQQAASNVGKELIKTARNIANDSLNGVEIKESLKNRTEEGINNLSSQLISNLNGSGFKRRFKKSNSISGNNYQKKISKKRKKDIFD